MQASKQESLTKTCDAYCCHPLILVKWIPPQTHHHGQHNEIFGWQLWRSIAYGVHSGVSIVYPRLSDADHMCDGFIGQVGLAWTNRKDVITEGSRETYRLDIRDPCSLFQSHVVQFPRVELGMDSLEDRGPRRSVCCYEMVVLVMNRRFRPY